MAVDLSDYTESLKREINPPGVDLFSSMTPTQLTAYMSDAFWEASLDGFFTDHVCDEDGIVTPVEVGGAELDRAGISLIVLYAGIRMLRNKILNTNTTFRAQAGPVEFEQQNSATVLKEMLTQLAATKERLLDQAQHGVTLDAIFDGLSTRTYNSLSYYGGPELAG